VDDTEEWIDEGYRGRPIEPREDVRAAYCRKVAETLLKRSGITEAPVPVRLLAEKAGLTVVEADLARGVDAILKPEERAIEIARGQAGVRHRFSIAHELGHHRLGHVHGESDVVEQQANIFVGALLVPRAWLKKDLPIVRTPEALARKYEVSSQTMFIALKDARLLNKIP
jgi:Zn-dependent peptidase ImmA (M78 family)